MATNPPKNLLELDNAILDKILRLLPFFDLLLCSRTCGRLQELAQYRFRRSFHILTRQRVYITFADSGSLHLQRYAPHFRLLDNVIKILTITSRNYQKNKNVKLATLTHFMLRKCDPDFLNICIDGDLELAPFARNIENILRNVKSVAFLNRKRTNDEVEFLGYCPEIIQLTLGMKLHTNIVTAIARGHYPHLRYFNFTGAPIMLNSNILKEFIETHDKIEFINWKLLMDSGLPARNSSVKWIETLRYAQNLRSLRVFFDDQLGLYTHRECDTISKQLNELCNRKKFQSLQVEFVCPWDPEETGVLLWRLESFKEFKQLRKIHFHRFRLSNLISKLRLMKHLRTIVLSALVEEDEDDYAFIDEVLRVSQIQNVIIQNYGSADLTQLCMPIVRHWRNVNQILLLPAYHLNYRLDVATLNRARQRLRNACELTIFTNVRGLTTNLQHELVQLRYGNYSHKQ